MQVMVKETVSKQQQQQQQQVVESLLVVVGLHPSDKGRVSCAAPFAQPATVTLTVTHPRKNNCTINNLSSYQQNICYQTDQ